MTAFEIYIFILCLVVFVLLVALSAISLTSIVKMDKKLIRCGANDEQLIKEQKKIAKSCNSCAEKLLYIFGVLFTIVFVAVAVLAICMNFQKSSTSDTIPTLRVVVSTSMSDKLESNSYLEENNLDDQFDMFDIVLTYKMPDEYDLELYDIVVYEIDGTLVIHRIVAIEEPNDCHPDCRYFTLRGDNVQYSDSAKVTYDQMLGIYRGQRIRFVGSFILFLQSPAGWLCAALLIASIILIPVLDSHIGKIKQQRLDEIQNQADSGGEQKAEKIEEKVDNSFNSEALDEFFTPPAPDPNSDKGGQ